MLTRPGPVRFAVLLGATVLLAGGVAFAFWRSAPGGAEPRQAPFPQIPAPDPWHGVSWSVVEWPAFLEPGTINGATTYGSSIVAWGHAWVVPTERPDPRDGLHPQPVAISVIWRSTDGEGWTRSLVAIDGKPASPGRLALGPAGMAGVAYVDAPGGGGRAVLIGSPDGDVWVGTDVPRGIDVTDVLPTADGFVAVGRAGERPVSWFVGAGAAAPAELPSTGRASETLGGAAVRDGLILVGQLAGPGDPEGVLWLGSADAWTLHRVSDLLDEDPDRATVTSIVPFAGGLFARGWSGIQPACLARAGGLALTAGPLVADHGEGLGMCEATWVSADGVTWRRGGMPKVPQGEQGFGVVAGGDGLLTVADEAQPFEERPRPALWTTADGLGWRRIGDVPPEAFGGTLHAIPGRVLLIGSTEDGTRPRVWLGTPVR